MNKINFNCFIRNFLAASLVAFFMTFSLASQAQDTSWAKIITDKVNLDTSHAFTMAVTDINNDNYPDIAVIKRWSKHYPNGIRIYFNIQNPSSNDPMDRVFVDGTPGSGVNSMPNPSDTSEGTMCVAFADINNDGNIDMVRGSYYHDIPEQAAQVSPQVLLGDGAGHFQIIPDNGLDSLGVTNVIGFSFLDYNKDGNIDLFIARWFKRYRPNNVEQTGVLMRGNGDGTFTNVTTAAGITTPEPMYGVSAVDWNNDGWPDIATDPYCRDGGQLLKNNHDGTFTNVAAAVGYNAQYMQGDNGQNLCMWNNAPEDFDNDGDMDFMFALVHGGNDANEGHSTLVINEGPQNDFHLHWDMDRITWAFPRSSHHGDYDATWFDFDNDGLEDIALAQGHYMPTTDRLYIFHQNTDHTFSDITQAVGLIDTPTKDMHYVRPVDFDLDGDDDILVSKEKQPSQMVFIKNTIGQDNHWIGVRLNAPNGVNKSSIGARIYLWAGGVQRMREVYAGRGNGAGQQPFALLFGLGDNDHVDSIKVRWPDSANHYTVIHPTEIDKYIEIGPGVDGGGFVNTGINEVKNAKPIHLKVYPNPTSYDYVLLQMSDNTSIKKISIYNTLGKLMTTKKFDNNAPTQYCPLKGLTPGQYILNIRDTRGRKYSRTIIKL